MDCGLGSAIAGGKCPSGLDGQSGGANVARQRRLGDRNVFGTAEMALAVPLDREDRECVMPWKHGVPLPPPEPLPCSAPAANASHRWRHTDQCAPIHAWSLLCAMFYSSLCMLRLIPEG